MTNPQPQFPNSRYTYVAYPMSLTLRAANAIQTYHTARELRALVAVRGGTVQVIVPRLLREPSRFADPAVAARHLPRIPFNKFTRFWKSSAWSYLERTAWCVELLALLIGQRLTGRGIRAIYVRDVVCAYWLSRLRVLHGARVVYEVHDLEATNPSRAQGAGWDWLIAGLDAAVLRRPARLVSLTAAFRAYLAEQRIRPPQDVAVIPDAYDAAVYRPLDHAACRAALDLPTEAYIVCYAGLTFAYRRLDLLLAAFAEVYASSPDPALLVLVGGRPFEVAELQREAVRLGLPPDAVRWVGPQAPEEVVQYLNAADVLVIPDTVTTLTASPLKLFEYMAVGKAIVLRELPALREILDDSSALFVPPGDAAALAAALNALATDPARRARLGAAALAQAGQYTYGARATAVLAVLDGVGGTA